MTVLVEAGEPAEETSIFTHYPWVGIARLLEQAPALVDLGAHRLELLYAALLRERGLPAPGDLETRVRTAQLATLSATVLLGRIRAICAGPILVLKGPEVAARYPTSSMRPFGDIDLLVPDAEAVQARLEAEGFTGIGEEQDWDTLHHLRRLAAPDRLFAVEVHRRPKWVAGLVAPSVDELLLAAVPSATGVRDVLAPSPPAHAVLLAAHAWEERPLGCIGDLLDVVVMVGDRGHEADELARRFGLTKVWAATVAAAEALFGRGTTGWPLRTWARHLPQVRGQTVFESHLERVLAPFAALPWQRAAGVAGRGLAHTMRPRPDETWSDKAGRTWSALRHASVSRSEHERHVRGDDSR